MAAQDLTTMGDNSKRSQLELSFLYATHLLNVLYRVVKYHENILKSFRVMVRTKFYNLGRLWTHELSQLELSFLHATLLPNALYNLTKFHEKGYRSYGPHKVSATDRRTDRCQRDHYIPRTYLSGDKKYPVKNQQKKIWRHHFPHTMSIGMLKGN